MWPAALLAHQRQRGVRAVEEAEHVDLDHLAPLAGVGALDRAEQHHAGVVDERVDPPEPVLRGLDEPARLLLGRDVDGDRGGRAALSLDLLGERVDAIGAPRAERDGGAGLRAEQRGRGADPG